MTTLIAAIFVASLLGSLHCAGMCGAFVAIACGAATSPDPTGRLAEAARLQAAYHLGRLVTYVTLGALAGAAGRLLDLTGALAGVQPVAATLAGATIVAFALLTLMKLRGWRVSRLTRGPTFLSRLLAPAHRAAMRRPPVLRAAMIGLFTTLLPCGWLYAFVITAAGTASPVWGAVAMAVFWGGTLPMLVCVGAGARRLLGSLGAYVPVVTCVLLAGVGVYTIVARGRLDPVAIAQTLEARHPAGAVPEMQTATTPCCSESE